MLTSERWDVGACDPYGVALKRHTCALTTQSSGQLLPGYRVGLIVLARLIMVDAPRPQMTG